MDNFVKSLRLAFSCYFLKKYTNKQQSKGKHMYIKELQTLQIKITWDIIS